MPLVTFIFTAFLVNCKFPLNLNELTPLASDPDVVMKLTSITLPSSSAFPKYHHQKLTHIVR